MSKVPNFMDAQTALGLLMPSFYNVQTEVYKTKYPASDYASLLPVITEGNEWAAGALFRVGDAAGTAEFISGKGFDMPYADISIDQKLQSFEMAGIGYEWTLEEMNRAAMMGQNLGTDKADAAHKIAERKLFKIALSGTTEKNWTGLINDPNATAADVAANGTGSTTWWANKTADQIIDDVNTGIESVYTATLGAEIPDTLLLPTGVMSLLSKRLPDTNETLMTFLQRTNRYTARTGQAMMVAELFELNTADPGGDGRAVLYSRNRDVVRFHLPMPHKFLPPFQKSSMTWEVAGIMRTGGTEVRLPKAVRYLDGILDS